MRKRMSLLLGSLLVVGALAGTSASAITPTAPIAGVDTLYGDAAPSATTELSDTAKVQLGVKFTASVTGQVTGVRFWKAPENKGTHVGTLWTSGGQRLASATFTGETASGWQSVRFSVPVTITPGVRYVASYLAPVGRYSYKYNPPVSLSPNLSTPASGGGVYRYGSGFPNLTYQNSGYYVDVLFVPSATPTPTTTPDPTPTTTPTPTPSPTPTPTPSPTPQAGGITALGRSFPSPATTGVPEGTTLSAYTGPCTIQTPNVVIDAKIVNCDLQIAAKGVSITRSKIVGSVYADANTNTGSFTITDSFVDMGTTQPGTGIGDAYFTATRVHVTGGNRSINCYKDCTVQDSYVNDQFTDKTGVYHESGIRVNTNSHLVHNTIGCSAPDVAPDAGCSAAITGYPDFDPVTGNIVDGNLILGGSGGYCSYGGSTLGKPYSGKTHDIQFLNNVYQKGASGKCGFWGPITSFDTGAPGNVWSNNRYDDGTTVAPAN